MQRLCSSTEEIPKEFCHISFFGHSDSRDYKAISRAAIKGFIGSLKVATTTTGAKAGPVYVNEKQGREYIDKLNGNSSSHDRNELQTEDVEFCSKGFSQLVVDVRQLFGSQLTLMHQLDKLLVLVGRLNSELGVKSDNDTEVK